VVKGSAVAERVGSGRTGDIPLDLLSPAALVEELVAGQAHVPAVVRAASAELATAAEVMATAFLAGGRIVLLGAGTSGRLAAMEVAELPGTFGLPADRVLARVAGATPERPMGADGAEDDADLGRADVMGLGMTGGDVLVAVAASGTTPYTVAAAAAASAAGAAVIAVINVGGSPLAATADVAIELPTGPEVLIGSTRLAAGSAQKLALNTLTTAAMVRAGRVHGRFMVDVVPANAKLVRRVADLVAESCEVDTGTALAALGRCGNDPRVAIVHLLTGLPPAEAARRAAEHRTVRAAASAG
jgi:N-acetylmuramic acid 6-phosphate etherase